MSCYVCRGYDWEVEWLESEQLQDNSDSSVTCQEFWWYWWNARTQDLHRTLCILCLLTIKNISTRMCCMHVTFILWTGDQPWRCWRYGPRRVQGPLWRIQGALWMPCNPASTILTQLVLWWLASHTIGHRFWILGVSVYSLVYVRCASVWHFEV